MSLSNNINFENFTNRFFSNHNHTNVNQSINYVEQTRGIANQIEHYKKLAKSSRSKKMKAYLSVKLAVLIHELDIIRSQYQ